MVLQELFIIATVLLIIDLILFGIGGFMAYQNLMPLIIRKLSEKRIVQINDSDYEKKTLIALRQVAKDYPESKKFMLTLKQILITSKE